MRLRWGRVRRADIPSEERDVLSRCGEQVIALMLTSGLAPRSGGAPGHLQPAKQTPQNAEALAHPERSDLAERREGRLEILEWAILLLVFLEVVADFDKVTSQFANWWHPKSWRRPRARSLSRRRHSPVVHQPLKEFSDGAGPTIADSRRRPRRRLDAQVILSRLLLEKG